MSIFNGTRLTNQTFKLDNERMRHGWYSDKYFENVVSMLGKIATSNMTLADFEMTHSTFVPQTDVGAVQVGDIEIEMQFYTRRPFAVIAGVDKALTMLRYGCGYYDQERFVPTWRNLQVEAVHDGAITTFDADWRTAQPVIRVRGRYRDFALLETPMLGVLTRASRITTNVYEVLKAAHGKPVLFYPARYDAHEVQAADGYAYDLAVKRFTLDYRGGPPAMISTDAQGDWWGGASGGTVDHAAIAAFLGNTAAAMVAFARFTPPEVPRIALVDFHNHGATTACEVARTMFNEWWQARLRGDVDADRYRLFAVRLNTSPILRDEGVAPLGDPHLDNGVNPRLVWAVRQSLDEGWRTWGVDAEMAQEAEQYCKAIKIVVSGGFNPEKIRWFETLNVPADIYGTGTSILTNDATTDTDFTAEIVRVNVLGTWHDVAKAGRRHGENADLEPVDLGGL
jgi:nicotinate phosphoribosyltransferase